LGGGGASDGGLFNFSVLCAGRSKSSDPGDLGERAGTVELMLLLLGVENQMACPAWSEAPGPVAKKNTANNAAAKIAGRCKWAELKSISNYQAIRFDTRRQK
jgi:hypothetical protein